jgi:hypothetical protein
MQEPMRPPEARKLIREILDGGTWVLSPHAMQRQLKRDISDLDCANVLRGGIVEEAEWENGAWRYRVRTQRFVVVVEFAAQDYLVVVSAWRQT